MQFSDVTEMPYRSILILQTEPFWFQRLNVVQPLLLSAKKKVILWYEAVHELTEKHQ